MESLEEMERACFYYELLHNNSWTDMYRKKEVERLSTDMREAEEVGTSVVTLLVPDPFYGPLQQIRTQLSNNIRCGPHITLVDPFMTAEGFPDAAARIREKLKDVEPFRLRLLPFNYFKHKDFFTLWLDPVSEPEGALYHLQQQILSAHPNYNRVNHLSGMGFRPHMSIAKFRGKTQTEKWMEENKDRFTGIEFEVREVYIMSRGPDPNKYEVRHTIPLGSGSELPPYFPEIPFSQDCPWLKQARAEQVPQNWTEDYIAKMLEGQRLQVERVTINKARKEALIDFVSREEKLRALSSGAPALGLIKLRSAY